MLALYILQMFPPAAIIYCFVSILYRSFSLTRFLINQKLPCLVVRACINIFRSLMMCRARAVRLFLSPFRYYISRFSVWQVARAVAFGVGWVVGLMALLAQSYCAGARVCCVYTLRE